MVYLVKILIVLGLMASTAQATKVGSVAIRDSSGTRHVNLTGNAVDVAVQDQHTQLVDLHLFSDGATTGFSATQTAGDNSAHMDGSHGLTVGTYVMISEGTEFADAEVLAINVGGDADSVTFDTPLDFAWTTAAVVQPGSDDLTVDGSSTPVVFSVSPKYLANGQEWDIVRFIISITDGTAMDDGTFGGITALTNGIVIQVKQNGGFHNIFNAKTNGALAAHSYDVTYAEKPPSGTGHGLRMRRTFGGQSKNGVVVRLCSTTDDEFRVIVQDNLTGLVTFLVVAQGHVVE